MKLYRVFTEYKNRKQLEELVATVFEGFTVFGGVGYWRGKPEASLVIEINCEDSAASEYEIRLKGLAYAIKAFNKQEAVLIEKLEIKGEFV